MRGRLLLLQDVFKLTNKKQQGSECQHVFSRPPALLSGKEFIRHAVASCSSWAPVNPLAYTLGPLPTFPPTPSKLMVAGAASIWYYLDGESEGVAW